MRKHLSFSYAKKTKETKERLVKMRKMRKVLIKAAEMSLAIEDLLKNKIFLKRTGTNSAIIRKGILGLPVAVTIGDDDDDLYVSDSDLIDEFNDYLCTINRIKIKTVFKLLAELNNTHDRKRARELKKKIKKEGEKIAYDRLNHRYILVL